jgi:P4 family phage/plasmid primase-like protien
MTTTLFATAEQYTAHNRGLCVITKNGPFKGKKPLRTSWVENPQKARQVKRFVDKGHNLGWVLAPGDLVVDIDPRNGGLDTLPTLLDDMGFGSLGELAQQYPVVVTGSGGYHIYTRVGADFKTRNDVERYGKGIEFKSFGRQVIIPGSIHPETGTAYKWYSSPATKNPLCPEELQHIIERRRLSKQNARSFDPEHLFCTPEELSDILAQIPVDHFDSDSAWLQMLCACHYATGGDGLGEFVEWSQSYGEGDPKPVEEIEKRWESLSVDGEDLVTAGTLIKHLRTFGGALPGDVGDSDPLEDFSGYFDGDTDEELEELLELKEQRRQKLKANAADRRRRLSDQYDELIDGPIDSGTGELGANDPELLEKMAMHDAKAAFEASEVGSDIDTDTDGDEAGTVGTSTNNRLVSKDIKELSAEIAVVTPASSSADITKLLRRVAKTEGIHRVTLIRDLSKNAGILRGDVKAALHQIGKKEKGGAGDIDDLALKLSTSVRNKHYGGGKHLLRTRGMWYRYKGTHWEPIEGDLVDQAIFVQSVNYRKKNPDDDTPISSLIPSVERILRARQAKDGDVFGLNETPKPIINTANGELHLNASGGVKFQRHSHESYLLHCLHKVTFKRGAECPLMDKTLREIFKKDQDRERAIEHFWEMAGYIIQPFKNIAAWFILHGAGSNGKTLLMKVLTELLGDAGVQMGIGEFHSKSSPHAFSVLPGKLGLIDDDVKKKTILPDDFLKKISEKKTLWANPKGDKYFPFIACLTPLLAANHFPKLDDLSEGMIRRVYVIPFRRRFPEKMQDKELPDKIIAKEMSGVLNRALEGLKRLRARGYFDPPASCHDAKAAWLYGANTTAAFIQDCIERDRAAKAKVNELFDHYTDWCDDQEIEPKYRLAKRALSESFVSLGFTRGRLGDGSRTIDGLALKEFDRNGE